MAVEQLAHCAYPTLPEDHIRREVGKDPNIKIQLLLRGEKTINKALRQALELHAILVAARSHKTSTNIFSGSQSPPHKKGTQSNQNAGIMENRDTSRVCAPTQGRQKMTGTRNKKTGHRRSNGNRQGLNGDQITTEKQTGGVASRRETNGSWWKKGERRGIH
jgi:hypothetical protein